MAYTDEKCNSQTNTQYMQICILLNQALDSTCGHDTSGAQRWKSLYTNTKVSVQIDGARANLPNTLDDQIDTSTISEIMDNLIGSPQEQNNECQTKNMQARWIECTRTCYSQLRALVDKELKTTRYMLELLSTSIIEHSADTNNADKTLVLRYVGTGFPTNVWKEDLQHLYIHRFGNQIDSDNPNRLIMGLGPSSAGKTFWARKVIERLTSPGTAFLTVDGGQAREASTVYQSIVRQITERSQQLSGISNLVQPGAKGAIASATKGALSTVGGPTESIFDSTPVKNSLLSFLEKPHGVKLNLYVPETRPTVDKLQRLKRIVKMEANSEDWVALHIWQHLQGSDCNFQKGFQCMGCRRSGKERETTEGKKYSSTAYCSSQQLAIEFLKKNTGLALSIHNSGGRTHGGNKANKSTVYVVRNPDSRYSFGDWENTSSVISCSNQTSALQSLNSMNKEHCKLGVH